MLDKTEVGLDYDLPALLGGKLHFPLATEVLHGQDQKAGCRNPCIATNKPININSVELT